MNHDTFTVRLAGTRIRFLVWPGRDIPLPSADGTLDAQFASMRTWLRHLVFTPDRPRLDHALDKLDHIRLGLAVRKVATAWKRATVQSGERAGVTGSPRD